MDKFLQVSRLVKRRAWAKELCLAGKVTVNGRPAKPSSAVQAGDLVRLVLDWSVLEVQVQELRERASAEQARQMYSVVSRERRTW